MGDYLEKGKEVLSVLTNSGYQAYLIGGVVRNTILGIDFREIDITTSATPEMIRKCFIQTKVDKIDDGSIRLFYAGYEFIISTFKTLDNEKEKVKTTRTHYSKVLEDDLECRDFTINAIAMSHGGKLTDAFNGYQDLTKKIVRSIGPAKSRFLDDPIKIIRGIRLVSELGFKIERKTYQAMKKRAKFVKNVDMQKLIIEIIKILDGKYLKKALGYMKDCRLMKYIPVLGIEFKRLANHFRPIDFDTFLECAFVKNEQIDDICIDFAKNPSIVKQVYNLAIVDPKSKYDNLLLFNYGIDICLQANLVNYLLKKGKKRTKKIKLLYNNLPIKDVCDLEFKGEDILTLTQNAPGSYVQTIVDNIIYKVLNGELLNVRDNIKAYAINSLKEMGILEPNDKSIMPDTEPINSNFNSYVPKEVNNPVFYTENYKDSDDMYNNESYSENNVTNDLNDMKLNQIERRISEQEQRIREKENKILELEKQALRSKLDNDVNQLVTHSIELLRDLDYIKNDSEAISVKRDLKNMYQKLLSNIDPKFKKINEEKLNEEN